MINKGLEGRVFLCETVQRFGHIDLRLVVHRLDRQRNNRGRYMHGAHGPVETGVAEGITGGAINTEQGNDVS